MSAVQPLLEIRDLRTGFQTVRGWACAADGIHLDLEKGKTLCLVGESGCGKTVTGLSILRLIPSPPGRILKGRILFQGKDLLQLPEKEMRLVRGNSISMIFQEPMSSLNPVFTIGDQVAEAIRLHQKHSRKESWKRAVKMLSIVGLPSPEKRARDYPSRLSGGMRQRAMIAMALSCRPDLLIADEPTTALDVTIQAQILELLARLQEELGMAVLFITHDLGVVAQAADDVAIMYAGRIVEKAPVRALFKRPRHPYTIGLLDSVPGPRTASRKAQPLRVIPGTVPNPLNLPQGCRFQERCGWAITRCREEEAPLQKFEDPGGPERMSACWRFDELPAEQEAGERTEGS